MIKYSTTDINKLYEGSDGVKKMYYGSTLSFVKYKGAEPIQPMLKVEQYSISTGQLIDSLSMDDDGSGVITSSKMFDFKQNNKFNDLTINSGFKIIVGNMVDEIDFGASSNLYFDDINGHSKEIKSYCFSMVAPSVKIFHNYTLYKIRKQGNYLPFSLVINPSGSTFYGNNFGFINGGSLEYDFTNSSFIGQSSTLNQTYFVFTYSSGIKSITLPSTVTTLRYSIYGCDNLEWIELKGETPPTINDSSSLTSLPSLTAIYVPSSAVDTYKSADRWSDFANIITSR